MRILLVSTYELGHQPLHVASPAAALRGRNHEVRAVDVSVQPWDPALVEWADGVAFSVPMHTAMRMALSLAASVRVARPELPICLYGLYAAMGDSTRAAASIDRVIVGEYEPGLLQWADSIGTGEVGFARHEVVVHLGRSSLATPARDLLPPLENYARLVVGEEERLAAAVEASHGCSHRCRHCPLPVIYDGRLRIVPEQVVLADVAQLVAMGARHLSFADPDFLNGPRHSLRVVQAVHACFPELSFDLTTKVEHVLEHAGLWAGLAEAGCLFVVSAFESVDDESLRILDKGHTAADASAAVVLLRRHGIEVRPSWLPFAPWTKASELAAMLDFVAAHDLVDNVDAVQYTIRLLLPEGSLLLSSPKVRPRLERYDSERLSWLWTAAEPGLDDLQAELAQLVETATSAGCAAGSRAIFEQVRARVSDCLPPESKYSSNVSPWKQGTSTGPPGPRPRLSEPWFCCSEPTSVQQEAVGAKTAN